MTSLDQNPPNPQHANSGKIDPVLSPRVVADALGISRVTLWRMSRDGIIAKPIRISAGRTGWRKSYIEQYLDSRIGA